MCESSYVNRQTLVQESRASQRRRRKIRRRKKGRRCWWTRRRRRRRSHASNIDKQQIEEEKQQHFRLLVKTSRYFPSSETAPPVLAVMSPSFCRLVNPLRLWGIAHSSLQKRHQVRSARFRRYTIFDNLAPLAEHSADILVAPRPQTPAQCGFFRSHLLVICTAKPRYTAAAAREHWRVLAPRLPTPIEHTTRGAL